MTTWKAVMADLSSDPKFKAAKNRFSGGGDMATPNCSSLHRIAATNQPQTELPEVIIMSDRNHFSLSCYLTGYKNESVTTRVNENILSITADRVEECPHVKVLRHWAYNYQLPKDADCQRMTVAWGSAEQIHTVKIPRKNPLHFPSKNHH